MAIIVFQHDDRNTAGRLGMTLRDHGFKLDIRKLHRGDPVPADLDDVDGVISLGGKPNVADSRDDHPWIDAELEFLRAAHERALPVVGICLGHQMIAAALGGEVAKCDKPEAGFVKVRLTPAAHTDEVFAGIAWDSPQFETHGCEVVTPPPGAVVLAASDKCKVQSFKAGMRTYGFQYHFELDRDDIARFVREGKQSFYDAGLTFDDVSKQADRDYPMFARLGDRLCVNLAAYIFTLEMAPRALS
jgi:GMP synthase-like glutamine amidotransferase